MTVEALRPFHIRRAAGDFHLRPGHPVELPDDDAVRLLAKTDKIYPVLQPGDSVEWMSPALPKQQGKVLAVHPNRTFEVVHPLTAEVCRLPVAWVLWVVRGLMDTTGRPNA